MRLLLLLPLLLASQLTIASDFPRPSYAEVQAGLATPTGFSTHKDIESERVAPGSLGTTLLFSGYFPVGSWFTISPNFCLLTTDGRVNNDPSLPSSFKIRFSQREVGIDALFVPGDLKRLHLGIGSSFAWWTAAENSVRVSYEDNRTYESGRTIDSKAVLGRGVIHLALRNPEVSGASLKLVGAWPLAELLRLENTAATGYIGLQCGFSMILN